MQTRRRPLPSLNEKSQTPEKAGLAMRRISGELGKSFTFQLTVKYISYIYSILMSANFESDTLGILKHSMDLTDSALLNNFVICWCDPTEGRNHK